MLGLMFRTVRVMGRDRDRVRFGLELEVGLG